MDSSIKVLDLFSGIGGFSLGLERAGMETVAFCEYDKKCRQVLKKHWPDVPQYTDVRTLTGEQLEQDGIKNIGLICGGYPCQPFSLAGKRKGQADDRHLWPEFKRLVQEIRPTWVLCENVAGHISMGLDSVLADLESEAYACQAFVIPACAVGAFHRRDRVWILAHADKTHGKGRSVSSRVQKKHTNAHGRSCDGYASIQMAKELCRERSTPGKWLFESAVGRVANGVPGRVDRLEQLGNAVVPQIPEIIGRAIMEAI